MFALAAPKHADGLYEADLHEWALEQARLLRAGRLREVDAANLAEEIESVGRSQRSEIRNRLVVLIAHILKWEFQPDRRTYSWRRTIEEQRDRISAVIEDSPSLRRVPEDVFSRAYAMARNSALLETELPDAAFPEACPYALDAVRRCGFLPGPAEPMPR